MPYQQYQVPPVVSTPSYPHPLQPPAVVTTPYQPHVPTTPSSTRSSYIAPAAIPAPAVPPPVAEVVAPAQLPPAFIPQHEAPPTPPVQDVPQLPVEAPVEVPVEAPAEIPEEEASETRIPYWPQVSCLCLTHTTHSDFNSSRGTLDPTCHGQQGLQSKRNERLCPVNQRWLSKMMFHNPAKVTRRFQSPLMLPNLLCLAPRLHPQHKLTPNTPHQQIRRHHLLPRQLCSRWPALQNQVAASRPQSCPHSQEFLPSNHQLLPRLSQLRPRVHPQIQSQDQTQLPMEETARRRKQMARRVPRPSQLQRHQDQNPGPTFSRELPRLHALILARQVLLQLVQVLRSQTTSRWLTPSFLSMPIFTAAKSLSSSREALLIPATCVI